MIGCLYSIDLNDINKVMLCNDIKLMLSLICCGLELP